MISRNIPRDQRAVTRASGYAASAETASTMTTLPAVTSTLLTSAPPRPALLPRLGEVVQRRRRWSAAIGDERVRRRPDGQVDQHVHREADDQRDGDHHQFQARTCASGSGS